MKKVLLVMLLAASVGALQAQVKIGVKGGANLSNVVGSDGDGAKSKIGFNAGLQTEIPVFGPLSIQPEVLYSRQGAKSTEAGVPDLTVNLDYIAVPVLAKVTTPIGFFAETGPQFSYLMSAKAKQGNEKEDVKSDFKSTEFSWAFGLGFKTKSNVGINARYNLGLSKLQDDGNIKNSVFQLGLSFLFGGSK